MSRFHTLRKPCLFAFAIWLLPRPAAAYIDPGTTGMLSQVLYVLFYGALGVFFYFLRYIKSWLGRVKNFLGGLFGR
jgi:hypothetical protein